MKTRFEQEQAETAENPALLAQCPPVDARGPAQTTGGSMKTKTFEQEPAERAENPVYPLFALLPPVDSPGRKNPDRVPQPFLPKMPQERLGGVFPYTPPRPAKLHHIGGELQICLASDHLAAKPEKQETGL